MAAANKEKIFASQSAAKFVGRQTEIERLLTHASSAERKAGMLLLATPGSGASELLRQTYDRLFHEQRVIIPFYFAIRQNAVSGHEVAEDFLYEFIRQLVAFRRHDPAIVRSAVALDELSELSLSVSGIWIDRLIAAAANSSEGRTFLRTCFSAPIRAAAHGDHAFVMIDGVEQLVNIDDGLTAFTELKSVFENAGINFVISGYRRFLHGRIDCGRLELNNLDFENGGKLVEVFAKENGVSVTEHSRDLIAKQLAGNTLLTKLLLRDAADSVGDLKSFEDVEKAYTESMFGGRIARRFRHLFSSACRTADVERNVLRLLFDIQTNHDGRLERDLWQRRIRLDETENAALLANLNSTELIRLTSNSVEFVGDNVALSDYIAAQVRSTTAETRASVFSDSLAAYIKRAPEIMARHYRASSSFGVRQLLGAFDGRKVPTILLDYGEFRDEFKAAADAEVLEAARDASRVVLPRIFFTTSASSFYKPLSEIAESERSAIALGFETSDDNPNNEIVWIAAEIDSKLETLPELAEFWCDRLEAAAVICDFARFKIWLIAPEGFSAPALEILKKRNAYGSSRRQAELLRRFVDAPAPSSDELAPNEYEIVIPMDNDAELIAAHAVEEIAKRHNLDSKSINQIKTALIEACINASEHSLSPDRKIYQRFRLENDRVVLTVSNRGLRLASHVADEPNEGRRGWGLKLMRKLMDEVTIEKVDDGTRIVMTKYLTPLEASA